MATRFVARAIAAAPAAYPARRSGASGAIEASRRALAAAETSWSQVPQWQVAMAAKRSAIVTDAMAFAATS